MDIPTDNTSVMTLIASPAPECREVSGLTTSELLACCVRRPADEYAWQEFVRRFHPVIRHSVERALCFKTRTARIGNVPCDDEVIDSVVQMVYYKLVENRCQALKRLDATLGDSFRSYLVILSITTVREYVQGVKPS